MISVSISRQRSRVGNDTAMVYLANPNNPTGIPIDSNELRAFCRDIGRKTLVVVDEAYNELTDDPVKQSMVDLVRDNENVLVMRTTSQKSSVWRACALVTAWDIQTLLPE